MLKKFNKILLLFIVVFYVSLSLSFAKEIKIKPVELKKISKNLYEILGGQGAQGGLYIGDNGVLVIDAKMTKNSVDTVIKKIKELTDNPIKYLVNTHSDDDHVRGNQYFPKTVTFIAHNNCRKDFFHAKRDGKPSIWSKPDLAPFIPSITFQNKMNIYLDSRKIELWYFGIGHTTGDIVVYFSEEKTAFIGDQIFLERPQLIHSYKGGNSFEHVKTLTNMLKTLDAEKFCSGHSKIADRKTIKNHINQMKKYQQKVKALIKKGKTIEDILKEFKENEARLINAIYKDLE